MFMTSEYFYSSLPVLPDFSAVSDISNFSEFPDDWCVIVADIKNSTDAVNAGQYKVVNILGVSVISCITNIAKPIEIPYLFGGDGATLCVPGSLTNRAAQVLYATRQMAEGMYRLHLRTGIFPMHELHKAGHQLLVARHRVSKHYIQAAFAGSGFEYADRRLKSEEQGHGYHVDISKEIILPDYSGLECRWDNVPSKHGEIISLIIKAIAPGVKKEAEIYDQIIWKIREIYGNDEECRPVYDDGLRLTFDGGNLSYETGIRTFARGKLAYFLYWLHLRLQNVLGWFLMKFEIKTGEVYWGNYRRDLVTNTDFRKFDGMLREILSGTAAQREKLTAYLEKRYKNRECVYGIHHAESALITCLINKREGGHYHFVDGARGGYAIAAIDMKKRLKSLRQ